MTNSVDLRGDALTLAYERTIVVHDLSVRIPDRQITAIVGPNGCGKSTLLRALARTLRPRSGAVLLDGHEIHSLPSRRVAQKLSILPQGPATPQGLTVAELVSHGRFPHQRGFGALSPEDRRAIASALTLTETADLADREVDTLSGGQRQRVWIAMTLAQDTDLLLLDEPTTFLDIAHQLEVLQLLDLLQREQGRTIVMVVHDLNHAARFAHRIAVLAEGRLVAEGTPDEVLRAEVIRPVFGVEIDVFTDPRTGRPICVPYALAAAQSCSTSATVTRTVTSRPV